MTRPQPFPSSIIPAGGKRPSRFRALRAQRRDKWLAAQALDFLTAANGKRDLSMPGQTPTPGASPRPSLAKRIGPGVVAGNRQTEAKP